VDISRICYLRRYRSHGVLAPTEAPFPLHVFRLDMIKIAAQTLICGRAMYFFLADLQRLRPLTNGDNMTDELGAWPLCELTGADLQRH
jgi:hypothetical protein